MLPLYASSTKQALNGLPGSGKFNTHTWGTAMRSFGHQGFGHRENGHGSSPARQLRRGLAVLLVGALVVTACGDDDEATTPSETTAATEAPDTTAATEAPETTAATEAPERRQQRRHRTPVPANRRANRSR